MPRCSTDTLLSPGERKHRVRYLFAVLRAGIAVAILAAIVGQLLTSLAFWRGAGVQNLSVSVTNFFSFFTVESNVFSLLAMGYGAWLLVRKRPDPGWYLIARASIVTYMVTTGVVYNLLLRGIELPQGSTLAWSNEILHVVAPAYLLIDWLLAPGRRPMPVRTVWIVVIYPIVWAVFTMIRGPFVVDEVLGRNYWYPYPFLNPNAAPTGYLSVAFYVLLISVLIAAVGLGVTWVSRRFPWSDVTVREAL